MNNLESNSSNCDDVSSTKLQIISDSEDSNLNSPNDSDCDLEVEMTTNTTTNLPNETTTNITSPSPPASPVNDLVMNNRSNSIMADYTSCSHCANHSSSSSSSSSALNSTSTGAPLSDLSNKRLCSAKEVISLIRKGKFDEFLNLLQSKPNIDLNTFVNGNTALHYCLLFGKLLLFF